MLLLAVLEELRHRVGGQGCYGLFRKLRPSGLAWHPPSLKEWPDSLRQVCYTGLTSPELSEAAFPRNCDVFDVSLRPQFPAQPVLFVASGVTCQITQSGCCL